MLDQQDAQIAALRQDNAQKDARIAELEGGK
jgi:cell division protein FtsB